MNAAESIKQFFLAGGSSWVLLLLGGLSIASVTVVLERWLFYRTRTADLPALSRVLDQRLAAGQFDDAIRELGTSPSVAASIAAAGLRLAHLGPAAVDKAMQSATALERTRLEDRLAYLGTVGNNAPFIGLFGTVIGVIQAFEALGRGSASGVANNASQVASQAVMTAIAEALVATAVGILVALPAVAAYNYFQRRVTTLLSGSEVLSNLVLAYLSGRYDELGQPPPGEGQGPLPVARAQRALAPVTPPSDPMPEPG
jgi:biopolymer transport protein ExbB